MSMQGAGLHMKVVELAWDVAGVLAIDLFFIRLVS